jgi:hypothetical protein
MRAAASTLIVLALVAIVAYVALRGPDYAHVVYVPHTSPAVAGVAGRAVDGAGKPVPDVALTWFSAVESTGGSFGGTMFRGDLTEVRTAADGTFRLEGVRGQEGYVAVGVNDVLREGESGRVRLRAGFDATELELTVVEVPITRRLQGKVLNADGSPASSVLIEARGGSWRGSWQQIDFTDASGEFELVAPWAGGECELWQKTSAPNRSLGVHRLGTRGLVVHLP